MTMPHTHPQAFEENLLAERSSRLIGRKNIAEAMRAAIDDPTGRCHTLYFVGPGGIGKTRLLEEVDVIRETWSGQPFLCTNIIDLYDSINHSPSGIRSAIAEGFGDEFFSEFRS